PGSEGSLPVVFLTPAGNGDQLDTAAATAFPHSASNLVAIQSRHPNIEERDLRAELLEDCKRPRTIVHDGDRMALHAQQLRERFSRVAIIVGNQHPTTHEHDRWLPGTRPARAVIGYGFPRQPDGEFASPTEACAARLDLPSMQIHQPFRQRETNSQSAFGAIPGR